MARLNGRGTRRPGPGGGRSLQSASRVWEPRAVRLGRWVHGVSTGNKDLMATRPWGESMQEKRRAHAPRMDRLGG